MVDEIKIPKLLTSEIIESLMTHSDHFKTILGLESDDELMEEVKGFLSNDSKDLRFMLCDVKIYTSNPGEHTNGTPITHIAISDLSDHDSKTHAAIDQKLHHQSLRIKELEEQVDQLTDQLNELSKIVFEKESVTQQRNEDTVKTNLTRSKKPPTNHKGIPLFP